MRSGSYVRICPLFGQVKKLVKNSRDFRTGSLSRNHDGSALRRLPVIHWESAKISLYQTTDRDDLPGRVEAVRSVTISEKSCQYQ